MLFAWPALWSQHLASSERSNVNPKVRRSAVGATRFGSRGSQARVLACERAERRHPTRKPTKRRKRETAGSIRNDGNGDRRDGKQTRIAPKKITRARLHLHGERSTSPITWLGFDAAYDKTTLIGRVWSPPLEIGWERTCRARRFCKGWGCDRHSTLSARAVQARGSRARTCFREMCVGVAVAIMRKKRCAMRDRGIYVHYCRVTRRIFF